MKKLLLFIFGLMLSVNCYSVDLSAELTFLKCNDAEANNTVLNNAASGTWNAYVTTSILSTTGLVNEGFLLTTNKDEVVSLDIDDTLKVYNAGSMSVYLYPTTDDEGYQTIFCASIENSSTTFINYRFNFSSDRIEIYFNGIPLYTANNYTDDMLNKWNHLILTQSGTAFVLEVDKGMIGSFDIPTLYGTNSGTWFNDIDGSWNETTVGAQQTAATTYRGFIGIIDCFRIHPTVYTSEEKIFLNSGTESDGTGDFIPDVIIISD